MRKIGEGYYYNVYEIDNNKVLKKLKSKARIFLFIFISKIFNLKKTIKEYKNLSFNLKRLTEEYKNILLKIKDQNLIANPEFINDLEYKQDKVNTINKIIKNSSEKEFEKIVYDYIELLFKLWSFGVSDSIFNFSLNCGYDKFNKLTLFDFNELSFSKENVLEHIKTEIWLKRVSYIFLRKKYKEIFKRIMKENITEENLNKFWPN